MKSPSRIDVDHLPKECSVSAEPHEAAAQQAMLFDGPLEGLEGDGLGYRGSVVCAAAGIICRQLDYWARTGLLQPPVRATYSLGSQRLYSFRDILVLKIVKKLLDTGISPQQVHTTVVQSQDRGVDDPASITLMNDGTSVYECTSTDEITDLLQDDRGVFGIAVSHVWHEVEGTLADLSIERLSSEPVDELMERHRRRRNAS